MPIAAEDFADAVCVIVVSADGNFKIEAPGLDHRQTAVIAEQIAAECRKRHRVAKAAAALAERTARFRPITPNEETP